MVKNTSPQCCPVLAVACLLIQSQPDYQEDFLKDDYTFWEHRLLAKGVEHMQGPVKYDTARSWPTLDLLMTRLGQHCTFSGQQAILC